MVAINYCKMFRHVLDWNFKLFGIIYYICIYVYIQKLPGPSPGIYQVCALIYHRILYDCLQLFVVFYKCSYVNLVNPGVNKGENMVETWGRVLVSSGHTDYAKTTMKIQSKQNVKTSCSIYIPTTVCLRYETETILGVFSTFVPLGEGHGQF